MSIVLYTTSTGFLRRINKTAHSEIETRLINLYKVYVSQFSINFFYLKQTKCEYDLLLLFLIFVGKPQYNISKREDTTAKVPYYFRICCQPPVAFSEYTLENSSTNKVKWIGKNLPKRVSTWNTCNPPLKLFSRCAPRDTWTIRLYFNVCVRATAVVSSMAKFTLPKVYY